MHRRTKIVATIGPASSDERTIRRLLKVGVDIFRLNLSHGTEEEHRAAVARVRKIAADLGLHIPLLLDLMGPRYRLGVIPQGSRSIRARDRVTLGSDPESVDVPIGSQDLLSHLRPGERVLIDNGLIELKVEKLASSRMTARVITGGTLSSRKGINLPDSDLPFEVSKKDRADIRMAAELQADFLAASYVSCAADVKSIRKRVHEAGGEIALVAKLERRRAVDNLEEIVREAEAVMVARGDLGVEVPVHEVPVLQKRIIDAACSQAKPVIVATQMLESMIDQSRPTRAEVSDIANTVIDGADALLLSGETAVGNHPVETVKTMSRVIQEIEAYAAQNDRMIRGTLLSMASRAAPTQSRRRARSRDAHGVPEVSDAVARAAVFTARNLGARQIVAFSQSGFTARLVARYRPSVPITVFTNDAQVARRVQLLWGATPTVLEEELRTHHDVLRKIEAALRKSGQARKGERLIVLMGDPISDRALTNLMRIHQIGETSI